MPKQARDTTLILTGRSALSEGARARLAGLPAKVDYRALDVSDAAGLERLVAEIVGSHGGLNGVIHSAGVLRDSFVIKKTEAELRAVLAPKVAGLLALDAATRDQELDFFVLFSSLTAVFGNVGQADYAAANGFMDAYAACVMGLWPVASGLGARCRSIGRFGRKGACRWMGPRLRGYAGRVWRRLPARRGSQPSSRRWRPAGGLEAFVQALAFEGPQIAVLYGARESLRHRANLERATAQPPAQHAIAQVDPVLLEEKTVQRLKQAFAEVTKLEVGRVDAEEPLESYGINSIMITQLNQKLGVVFEGLSKTLFFEHRSLAALAGHLARDYAPACVAWTGLVGNEEASAAPAISPASAPVTGGLRKQQRLGWRMGRAKREPIAIIGLSGRYAQAETLGEYWENLKHGRDCIGEIPPERWALDGFYLPDADAAVAEGKSYSKWGGFLEGLCRVRSLILQHLAARGGDDGPAGTLVSAGLLGGAGGCRLYAPASGRASWRPCGGLCRHHQDGI